MPLVKVCTASDISEAIVMRSAFAHYGIRATLTGIEHCQQDWFVMQALQGVPVLVSDVDYHDALALYEEAQRVETVKDWKSRAFWKRPARNAAVVVLPWLCLGVVFMPWLRDWPREQDQQAGATGF